VSRFQVRRSIPLSEHAQRTRTAALDHYSVAVLQNFQFCNLDASLLVLGEGLDKTKRSQFAIVEFASHVLLKFIISTKLEYLGLRRGINKFII
jgi:hypothetical protein